MDPRADNPLLAGVSLMAFVHAMQEIDTVSVAAFKEHELDAFFGYIYGLMTAGITDHRISDAAMTAVMAVRNNPMQYYFPHKRRA